MKKKSKFRICQLPIADFSMVVCESEITALASSPAV